MLEERHSSNLFFLPGKHLANIYTFTPSNYDTVVAIDAGDLGRLGNRLEVFENAKTTVNIDHHSTNTEFAFHNYVDTKSSAVGEIILSAGKN